MQAQDKEFEGAHAQRVMSEAALFLAFSQFTFREAQAHI